MTQVYFAGNRVLLGLRSSAAQTFTTVPGTPARFNPSVVDGTMLLGFSSPSLVSPFLSVPVDAKPASAWLRLDYFLSDNGSPATAGNRFIEWVDDTGAIQARIVLLGSGTSYSNVSFQIQTSSGLTTLGSTFLIPRGGLLTFNAYLELGTSGRFDLYNGVSLLVSRTWTTGVQTHIAQVRIHAGLASVEQTGCSQVAVTDFDTRGVLVTSDVFNANGHYTDGAGAAADTADLDFATAKQLPAANDQFTGTKPARSLPAGLSILGVQVSALMRAGAPAPNARVLTRRASVDVYQSNISPPPSPGYSVRSQFMLINPTTGLPWTEADYNSTEIGWQARA